VSGTCGGVAVDAPLRYDKSRLHIEIADGGAIMNSNRRIDIIGAQMDLGASQKGVGMGPFAVRFAGLAVGLTEMGYEVKKLRLYSSKDNIIYPVPIPSSSEINDFEHTLNCMESWAPNRGFNPNPKKCRACIYSALCECFAEN
jgi:CRISPR/Cas system-associated exonuclease Cas4 (RecB family)